MEVGPRIFLAGSVCSLTGPSLDERVESPHEILVTRSFREKFLGRSRLGLVFNVPVVSFGEGG